MNKLHFLIPAALFFLLACKNDTGEQRTSSDTPNGISYKRGYQKDVLDEIYDELLEQSPELLQLEKEIAELNKQEGKAMAEFNKYNDRNLNYYANAEKRLGNIKDSLLKNSIELLIKKSQYAYGVKNTDMNNLIEALKQSSNNLSDHHEALKIILTMSLIEKHQEQKIPEPVRYKNLIRLFEETIHRNDSLM